MKKKKTSKKSKDPKSSILGSGAAHKAKVSIVNRHNQINDAINKSLGK